MLTGEPRLHRWKPWECVSIRGLAPKTDGEPGPAEAGRLTKHLELPHCFMNGHLFGLPFGKMKRVLNILYT